MNTTAHPYRFKPADVPANAKQTDVLANQAIAPQLPFSADLPLAELVDVLQEQQRLEAVQRRQAQAATMQARQQFD